jgi:hypothetical protein
MAQNYAIVENDVVINVVLWNGDTINNPLNLPTGWTIVLIPADSPAWTGWGYTAAGGFTPPVETN